MPFLAALCRAAISIRMRECAPRPCHAIGRKVALCRPMKKKIFSFFPPLFIESKRGDDLSSKKTDFSRKICTLGRKVLREDIFEEGEKGRMIMGSEENERILIGLGIWS